MASWKLCFTGVAVAAAALCASVPAAQAVTTSSSLSDWEANVGAVTQTAIFSGTNPSAGAPYAPGQPLSSIPLSLAGSVGYTNGGGGTGVIYGYPTALANPWTGSWNGTASDIIVGNSTGGSNISISKTSDYGFGFFLQAQTVPTGTTTLPIVINLISGHTTLATVDLSVPSLTGGSADFFGYYGDALAGVTSVQIVTPSDCGHGGSSDCSLGIGDFFESAAAAPVPTPEPATLAVLGSGLVGLGMIRRRKASKSA